MWREQYNPANFAHGRGLAVELAFLFHMLAQTAAAATLDGVGRCARPTNFLAAFKRVPRIVALGLGGGNPGGDTSGGLGSGSSGGVGAGGSATGNSSSGSGGSGSTGSAGGTAAEAMAAAATVAAGAVDARALGRDSGTVGTAAVAKAALAAAAAVTEDNGGAGGIIRSNSGGNLSSLFDRSDGGLGNVAASNSTSTAASKGGGAVALGVRAEAFHRFLVTEFDHELSELGAFTESGKPVKSRGSAAAAAAAAAVAADKNSSASGGGALAITGALAESYGTLLESRNSFVNPAFSADDTTTLSQTLMFDLAYPDPVSLTAATATATKLPRPPPPLMLPTVAADASSSAGVSAPVSFAELLRASLCVSKRSTARSETAAAQGYSSAYQKITQRKDPKSLPKVLALHANLHGQQQQQQQGPKNPLHTLWQRTNALGGAWLPRKVQIMLEPNAGGEPRVEVAEFVEPLLPEVGAQAPEEQAATKSDAGLVQGCWSSVSSSRIHGDPARWLESAHGLAEKGGAGVTAGEVREAEARAKAIASLVSNKQSGDKSKAEGNDQDDADATGNASGKVAATTVGSAGVDAKHACQFRTYELVGLVSQVRSGPTPTCDGHLVTHVREAAARGASGSGASSSSSSSTTTSSSDQDWVSFNDFAVAPCTRRDALAFHEQAWREPCVLVYRACSANSGSQNNDDDDDDFVTPLAANGTPSSGSSSSDQALMPARRGRRNGNSSSTSSSNSSNSISDSVFELPSLAAPRSLQHDGAGAPPLPPPLSAHPPSFRTPAATLGLPGAGDVVAIDTEFVSVGEEEGIVNADGTRTVVAAARQVLARVSAIDGRTGEVGFGVV